MREEEPAHASKSVPIGDVKLTDDRVRVSTSDGRDGNKSVDIRLFWEARHTARKKKRISGR